MAKMGKIIVILSAAVFISSMVSAGELDFGVQYQDWYANSTLDNGGWEFWTPLSLSVDLTPGFKLYGWSEFGTASYQYTASETSGTQTNNLTNISDSVVGGEIHFKTFSMTSMLNVGFNIPTGDPTWETLQQNGNIPTDFVDSRYYGRGFGVNALYGLVIPAGTAQVGAAVGYMHSYSYDPGFGVLSQSNAADELQMGDYFFEAVDHVQAFSGNQTQIIRLSAFQLLPTTLNGQNLFELGPNFNASYSWNNPRGFSLEAGAQIWLSSSANASGTLTTEPYNIYGPRFYITPSYAFGDFTIQAMAKYVVPNGYPVTNPNYLAAPGGYLLGIEPSYRMKLDGASVLKFYVSLEDILAQNYGQDSNGNPADLTYYRWVFGTNYELKI